MVLCNGIIVYYQLFLKRVGENGFAPVHDQKKLQILAPLPDAFYGDSDLFGNPVQRITAKVRLHQGCTVLVNGHDDPSTVKFRRLRRMCIFMQLLMQPLLIEKNLCHTVYDYSKSAKVEDVLRRSFNFVFSIYKGIITGNTLSIFIRDCRFCLIFDVWKNYD